MRHQVPDGTAIGDVPAKRSGIVDGIGFPTGNE
jgi:hypothetical protein